MSAFVPAAGLSRRKREAARALRERGGESLAHCVDDSLNPGNALADFVDGSAVTARDVEQAYALGWLT